MSQACKILEMSNLIQEHSIALNINMAKEKILTEEERQRKETLKRRMFYFLAIFDALLLIYLVIQIFLLF